MTGNEGRASVEQATANIAGRGYDQLEIGSSSDSSSGIAARAIVPHRAVNGASMLTAIAGPLRMESEHGHEMKDASAHAFLEPTVSVAHLAGRHQYRGLHGIREKERLR
jgi:hypothetical protein